jgi:hypothetical protein
VSLLSGSAGSSEKVRSRRLQTVEPDRSGVASVTVSTHRFGMGSVGRGGSVGPAISYVLLLTAFYVDNGPHLPLWRALPPLAHWLIPSAVGVPFLMWVHARHPLLSRSRRASNDSPGRPP